MKRNYSYLIFLLICMVMLGCKKDHRTDCFKGSGNKTSESRVVERFNHIDLSNKIDLIIEQDSFYAITVEGGENLIDGIVTEVKDSVLYIADENKCNWVRSFDNKYTVHVTIPDLEGISHRGSGSITNIDTLEINHLFIDFYDAFGDANLTILALETHSRIHTGPGDISLRGRSNLSYLFSGGNGFIHHDNLSSDIAFINCDGTGDFYTIADNIYVDITNIGNVFHLPSATIKSLRAPGKGRLIALP